MNTVRGLATRLRDILRNVERDQILLCIQKVTALSGVYYKVTVSEFTLGAQGYWYSCSLKSHEVYPTASYTLGIKHPSSGINLGV